jgi:hypothetical protein
MTINNKSKVNYKKTKKKDFSQNVDNFLLTDHVICDDRVHSLIW